MKLLIALLFVLFHLFVSGQVTAEDYKLKLLGRWDWIQDEIVDRGGGGIINPSTCGCEKYLIFEANDTVKEFRNDTLVFSSTFTLHEVNSQLNPLTIILRNSRINNELRIANDSMSLGPLGMCGTIYHYKRN